MGYKEQGFAQRSSAMGDQAESAFEAMMTETQSTYEVFGWRRPSTGMSKMSVMLRFMPDFYTGKGWLVEVMGCGTDGVLKGMKVPKWSAMIQWSSVQRVGFWLWNSNLEQGVWLDVGQMAELVTRSLQERGVQKFEVDGNEYYELPWEWLTEAGETT